MRLLASLFLLAAVCSPAFAHKDTALAIEKDGTIRGLPKKYQPASLKVRPDSLVLRVANNMISIPPCSARRFQLQKAMVEASASWYHDGRSGLPPYIQISIVHARGQHSFMNGYTILFNLVTAEIIEVDRHQIDKDEESISRFDYKSSCSASEAAGMRATQVQP